MILSDLEIKRRLLNGEIEIEPFSPEDLSPNGIDLRVGNKIVNINTDQEYDHGLVCEPDAFYLISTAERITLPLNVVGLVFLKSTWARMGVLIPPTVVDAGFSGILSLSLRVGPLPIKLEQGMKVWHLILAESYESTGYKGKYQNSNGLRKAITTGLL
ncbi:MAG: dCTP deaminase [Candidatus Micrarchaeaceae archaeon]